MSATDFHDVVESLGIGRQSDVQVMQGGQQPVVDFLRRRDVHRGRKSVVRRLAEIHVIVWMDRRFCSKLATQKFDCPVGDHLIGVHVALSAGSGLPNDERKVI